MKKDRRNFVVIAFSIVTLFVSLMVYALKQDSQFVPSQLVNKPAPEFAGALAQGGEFQSQNIVGKGRWVVMNFWSTTCVVCRYEAPELEGFYQEIVQRHDNETPYFISVNIQESVGDILGYARDYRLSFPILSDKNGKISLDFGVTGTPETFFIDPNGVVRHRVAGEIDRESIFRFIDWLERNPELSPEDATRGFAELRKKT